MPDETNTPDVAQPRRMLGKYELVERFERGGMATVYKAYDPTLDRYVAVKQIAAHLGEDPKFIERFRHEAQVLAKLGNEATHIVTIHELVEDDAGGLFIVMEYVEGRTLETYLQSAPISPAAAIKLMAQIGRGLRAVHTKGIIHRDIKPLNTIIPPQGRVKITDFGLAARSGGSTSMSMGTTKYMAPELFKGGPIDGRADLYSLGFMMYELLCPIDRFNEIFEDVLADERSEGLRWMSWHADRDRTVPPLVEVNDRVPRRLSLIVERLTAKDPDRRMYSADELLQELKSAFGRRSAGTTGVAKDLSRTQMPGTAAQAAEAGSPGEAQPARRSTGPGDTAPLPRQPNWRKRGILIGAAVVVLIVGLLVVTHIAGTSRREDEQTANENYDAAVEHYKRGEYAEAAAKYRIVIDVIGERYPDHPMVTNARMYGAMAEAYVLRDQQKWPEAEKRLDEADRLGMERRKIRRFRAEMETMKAFHALLVQADEAAEKHLFDDALKRLDEADALDPDRADVAQKRTDIRYRRAMYEGQEALETGDWSAARTKYLEAKRLRATAEVEARLAHIKANEAFYRAFSAGQEALKNGDFAAAVRHLSRALSLQPDKKVTDLLTDARYRQKMGEAAALEARQAWADALAAYQVAQQIKKTGEVQTRIAAVGKEMQVADLDRQANAALAAGDTDKAIDLLTRRVALKPSLEVDARIIDLTFRRAMDRGRAFERQEKWDDAETAYREALRIKNAPEADRAIREVQQRRKYATLLAKGDGTFTSGLFEQALQAYRDAKAIRPGEEIDRKIADCQYEIFFRAGKAQEDAGNFSGAYANYRRAVELKATDEAKEAIERVKAKMET